MLRLLARVFAGAALTGAIAGACCASRCAARMCKQENIKDDDNTSAEPQTKS